MQFGRFMTLEIDIVQEFLEYVIMPTIFSFITVPNFIFFPAVFGYYKEEMSLWNA